MAKKTDIQTGAENGDSLPVLPEDETVTAPDGAPVTHEGGAPDATGSAEPVADNPPATAPEGETQKGQGQDAGELSAYPETANVADRTDAILKEMLGVSDQPETQRFFLAGAVRLNGTLHEQGTSVRLTETEHNELLALGVIDEEWD